jgi:DNA-binding CsgD family transcriptional regulator
MTIFDIALDHERDRQRRYDNPYRLTARELDVARWLGRGLTPRRIAAQLGVVQQTVQAHRRSIMAKVGARNGDHLNHILCTLAGVQSFPVHIVPIEDFRDSFGPLPARSRQ